MRVEQTTFAFLADQDASAASEPTPGPQVDPPDVFERSDVASSQAAPSNDPAGHDEPPSRREALLRQLRRRVGCVTTASGNDHAIVSTGCRAIDDLLPRGGLRLDAVTEWIAHRDACGAAALSMITAANYLGSISSDGHPVTGPIVIVDRTGTFYPPAAVSLGIPADRMILVRPHSDADQVWAIDQSLRCRSVAAVWSQVGRSLDDRDARRFQLAAEQGRTPGLLVRPVSVRGRPTFADVRMHVGKKGVRKKGVRNLLCEAPEGPFRQKVPDPFFACEAPEGPFRQKVPDPFFVFCITVDRCRGGTAGRAVDVWIDDHARLRPLRPLSDSSGIADHHETATVRLASQLAHPATTQPATQPQRRRA
jgi:hypothetical protein